MLLPPSIIPQCNSSIVQLLLHPLPHQQGLPVVLSGKSPAQITPQELRCNAPSRICWAMRVKAGKAELLGNSWMKSLPSSKLWLSWGSRGTEPRKGTPACLASSSPPPLEKMFVHSEQCGQMKPLMFSTMPRTRKPVFLQNVSSRLTSPTDTA